MRLRAKFEPHCALSSVTDVKQDRRIWVEGFKGGWTLSVEAPEACQKEAFTDVPPSIRKSSEWGLVACLGRHPSSPISEVAQALGQAGAELRVFRLGFHAKLRD